MFVGRPPGNYDRLLDFSRAVTETLFFVPSATFLESVNDDAPAAALHDPEPTLDSAPPRSASGGSLGVGCLKGENRYEPYLCRIECVHTDQRQMVAEEPVACAWSDAVYWFPAWPTWPRISPAGWLTV